MAHYGKASKRKPVDILKQAVQFFGPGGLGLEVQSKDLTTVYFVGGGGHIWIQARKSEQGSEVDLETREWDYQVRRFMGEI